MATHGDVPFEEVTDSANWRGTELESGEGWKYVLTDEETDALFQMAVTVRSKIGNDQNALLPLDKKDFDLGAFSPKLDTVYDGLKNGLGVSLIRGLPLARLDTTDAAIIFWGIGRHLGIASPNNPEGDMLGHITDLGKTQCDPKSRGYQTREAMDYHCDQCDIVGLLCVRTAKSGGTSKIASSISMYNTLLKERPDYAQVLAAPFYWTKHGEHGPNDPPYYQSPVANFLDGKLCISFGPKHILKGHDLSETPDLTEIQLDALTRAEEIADEQHLAMELEVGDMQFVNNYVVLHTRSAFVDHDAPGMKRLLWRLWLMNPDLRSRTDYTNQWAKGVLTGNANARIAV